MTDVMIRLGTRKAKDLSAYLYSSRHAPHADQKTRIYDFRVAAVDYVHCSSSTRNTSSGRRILFGNVKMFRC